ncbi:MAG: Na/Pi symporter, partial [Paramuribaculum sp.]|nr:Na/Pi symporter [Paramuribaculum sp.]
IIALFGFKVNISAFVLPLIGLAIPLLFTKKSRNKSIGEFLIGFAFLFMGLDMISKYVPDMQSNPQMFAFLQSYSDMGFVSVLIFVLTGIILTAIIQSSAATFAITLIMCSKGWIPFELACAIVLGSHIGTTATPLLASLSGNVAAKRTAMGHLMFNVFGVAWMLCVFNPFVNLSTWITEAIGQGNPETLYKFVNEIRSTDPDTYNHLFDGTMLSDNSAVSKVAILQMSVSFGMSIFHTVSNLVNLSIMIWFTKLYVKLVEKLVPAKHKEDEEFQLKFISGGLMNASELNIAQAEKEIAVFAERVQRMIGMAQQLLHMKDDSQEFANMFSRLEKYEDISDRMEIEIAHYLNRCSEGRLSNEGKLKIASMLRMVSEIESIADCCVGAGKILIRKQQSHVQFNEAIYSNIDAMFAYVESAMEHMVALLAHIDHAREQEIIVSYNKEREINNFRNQLRTANIENINAKNYEYQAGIYYMDLIADLEKTGDYIINVVDAIREQVRLINA